ncbi:hypothetical protein A2U01_0109105, partial [Trifolium medium]|nr:hypothetical protein [Trifolium medium]
RPGMKIHQVLKRTGPEAKSIVSHQSVCPSPHQNQPPVVVVDEPDTPDSKHYEHGSDAPSA